MINFSKDTEFIVQPIVDGEQITKENWMFDDGKIKCVMTEVEKIGRYFKDYIETMI